MESIRFSFITDFISLGLVSIRVLADCLKKLGWRDADISEAVPVAQSSLTVEEANRLLQNLSTSDESRVALRDGGTKHWVVNSGKTLNVQDIMTDERFRNSSMKQSLKMKNAVGVEPPRTLLIGAVCAEEYPQKVIGLVEMVNKRNEAGEILAFSSDDEKLMAMLCHHCSTFIAQVEDG